MAGLTKDQLEARVAKWRKRWVEAENSAKAARMRIGKETKEERNSVLTDVFKAGFSKQAWRLRMLEWDHEDHRRGVYEQVQETEDTALIGEFAALLQASGTVGLPLFDAAEQEAIAAAAKAHEEADNVTAIRAA